MIEVYFLLKHSPDPWLVFLQLLGTQVPSRSSLFPCLYGCVQPPPVSLGVKTEAPVGSSHAPSPGPRAPCFCPHALARLSLETTPDPGELGEDCLIEGGRADWLGAEPGSPFQGHLLAEGGGRTPGVTFHSLCSGRVKSGNNSVCGASCISPGRLSRGECNCLRNARTNITCEKSPFIS